MGPMESEEVKSGGVVVPRLVWQQASNKAGQARKITFSQTR